MCLIAWAWRVHPAHQLVLAANRDEFHARPSAPLHRWPESEILAGRDLEAGGTWLGVAGAARVAAVTNFRDPTDAASGKRSRGALVRDFLQSTAPAADGAHAAHAARQGYRGFNLLLGDGEELWFAGSRAAAPRRLQPGVYALSNALLDTPWPKLLRAREAMHEALAQLDPELLLAEAFAVRRLAPDEALPDTGVGLEWERALSAPFIRTERYGTRSHTYLALGGGRLRMRERCYDAEGRQVGDTLIER